MVPVRQRASPVNAPEAQVGRLWGLGWMGRDAGTRGRDAPAVPAASAIGGVSRPDEGGLPGTEITQEARQVRPSRAGAGLTGTRRPCCVKAHPLPSIGKSGGGGGQRAKSLARKESRPRAGPPERRRPFHRRAMRMARLNSQRLLIAVGPTLHNSSNLAVFHQWNLRRGWRRMLEQYGSFEPELVWRRASANPIATLGGVRPWSTCW